MVSGKVLSSHVGWSYHEWANRRCLGRYQAMFKLAEGDRGGNQEVGEQGLLEWFRLPCPPLGEANIWRQEQHYYRLSVSTLTRINLFREDWVEADLKRGSRDKYSTHYAIREIPCSPSVAKTRYKQVFAEPTIEQLGLRVKSGVWDKGEEYQNLGSEA